MRFNCALVLSLAFATYSLACPHPLSGQQRQLSITDVKQVDVDFGFMGEFTGYVVMDGRQSCAGLQVVANGNGNFSAMYYVGGLPGNGWNRNDRSQLSGHRQGNQVTLASPKMTIKVEGVHATVNCSEGMKLGRLRKVIRRSTRLGAPAPSCAQVLYNGTDTQAFKNGRVSNDGWLEVGTELVDVYANFTLHLEFRVPYMPYARGQGRGNSGVYLQSRYEVQILDSFGLEGKPNECGGLYRYQAPDQNMALPPLSWQTYDIIFRSPLFDASGNKFRNARLTVLHNGVTIHDNFEVERKTGAGKRESPRLLPIKLQDHGNPVNFRNIWIASHDPPRTHPSVGQNQNNGRLLANFKVDSRVPPASSPYSLSTLRSLFQSQAMFSSQSAK